MVSLRNYTVITIISLFTFYSCKDPKEYRINPKFSDYLQRFENEAAARGHNFAPQTTGLIIEFANLSNSTAGLTHYETPIRIEIDRTYWSTIDTTAGADLMKEDLLFHELGHGLLGRSHLNTTLDNGDWKSIMCGGTKVGDRSWNINYHGMRRKYYVDELFDVNTSAPDFASMVLPADTLGFTTTYHCNFDNTSQLIWDIADDSQHKTTLDNGKFKFQSKVNMVFLVFASINNPISITSDFSYELTLSYPTGDASNQYGLVFGPVAANSNGVKDPVEYFSINNNQKMYMGNRSWYSYFTELTGTSIISGGANKLKVVKVGTFLYYFINNTYCYMNEIVAAASINQLGFIVPPLGSVWIDNFKISQRAASGSNQQKIKQNQPIGIKMQLVDKLFQTNPKNR